MQSLNKDGILTIKDSNHHIQEREQNQEAKADQQAFKRSRNISAQ